MRAVGISCANSCGQKNSFLCVHVLSRLPVRPCTKAILFGHISEVIVTVARFWVLLKNSIRWISYDSYAGGSIRGIQVSRLLCYCAWPSRGIYAFGPSPLRARFTNLGLFAAEDATHAPTKFLRHPWNLATSSRSPGSGLLWRASSFEIGILSLALCPAENLGSFD
jgi:hypothetical protein